MTLEETFAAINARNWRVLNLFQIAQPGTEKLIWRANVQVWLGSEAAVGQPSSFAEHKDPVQALRSAMANLENEIASKKPVKKTAPVLTKRELALEASDL